MRASCAAFQCHPPGRAPGLRSRVAACPANPLMTSWLKPSISMSPIAARWPRILSEHFVPVPEPLAVALQPAGEASPREVVCSAARALLDSAPLVPRATPIAWPAWLAPHQVPAAERLTAIIARHGGALLADEGGLGKSYVALAVALAQREQRLVGVAAARRPRWPPLLGQVAR